MSKLGETRKERARSRQGDAGGNSQGMVAQQFDELSEDYDADLAALLSPYMVGDDTEGFAEYKVQLTYNLLRKRPIHGILDFGCGTGRSIQYLKQYFGEKLTYYGCDISLESIQKAQEITQGVRYFQNDSIEKFRDYCRSPADMTGGGGGGYDLVFIACVFHHIPPDERVNWVRAILECLNRNGCIVAFEHNLKNPLTKKIVTSPDNPVDDIRWMLTPQELKQLLQISGIKTRCVWSGYTLFSPLRQAWMAKVEKLLKWCPLGAQHCVIVEKCE